MKGRKRVKRVGSSPRPDAVSRILSVALRQHQAGAYADAEEGYLQVARLAPRLSDAAYLLGVLYQQTGRLSHARAAFQRAVDGDGPVEDALLGLGAVALALGQGREAASAYEKALALNPGNVDACNNLGSVFRSLGEYEEAERVYRAALDVRPGAALVRCNLGGALLDQGRHDEARGEFEAALRVDKTLAEAYYGLAVVAEASGRRMDAIELCRKTVALDPAHSRAYGAGARLYRLSEVYVKSVPLYEMALKLEPESVDYRLGLAESLFGLGRADEAMGLVDEALALAPEDPMVHIACADGLKKVGRFDEAIAHYRKALSLDERNLGVYLHIAHAKKFAKGAREIAELEELVLQEGLPADRLADLHFALGKMLTDVGELERSFEQYRKGNGLVRTTIAFEVERQRDLVDRLTDAFSPDFFERRAFSGIPTELPVFIVGMPRSGTTLTESIIASHPGAHAAGELGDIFQIAAYFTSKSGRDYPECLPLIPADEANAAGGRYVSNLQSLAPGALRVVDKLPHNFLNIGLIRWLFPKARIVHVRRDPVDTCLSIYFQHFEPETHPYAWDLREIGLYYREYQRMMAHWRSVLPEPFLEVGYEDLIADRDAVARRLIDYCGLEWDSRCLGQGASGRPIQTASHWQVRQPIYGTSVGRWRAFGDHLAPLLDALGMGVGRGGVAE